MLKNMPDAQRGTNVEIQIDKGSLTVSAEGRLKTDARVGETVLVLCTETGKVLSGVLTAPGRVAIIDSRGEL
jgi:flagella basal body P-ring formation protein FlgA